MTDELFGTMFKPNARWKCGACNAANITKMLIPLRAEEPVACRKCHRITRLRFDLSKVPQCWGGKNEVKPEGSPA
jgi:hypothetical protein